MAIGTTTISCDVGGTHLSISAVRNEGKKFAILDLVEYRSKQVENIYTAIDQAMERFSSLNCTYAKMVISAAGIVVGTRCTLSNLAWTIDSEELSKYYKMPVLLINDFTAISYALPLIDLQDRDTVVPVIEKPTAFGVSAAVGAGTGLGVSGLLPYKGSYICLESEGGHADVSPIDELTLSLYEYYIKKINNPPGAEYFVSGPGIARIFYFFADSGRFPKNAAYERIMSHAEEMRPEQISLLSAEDPHCREVMRVFVSLYARIASNIAITFSATGGIFLAGGIARKIIPLILEDDLFSKNFLRNYHHHLRNFLTRVPVYIICDYSISLLGAAHLASMS